MAARAIYKTDELNRQLEKEGFTINLPSGSTFTLKYIKPGILQFAKLQKAFVRAFLPQHLSEYDISRLDFEEQKKLSKANLERISEDINEENENEVRGEVYGRIFMTANNSDILKEAITISFPGLDVDLVDDFVLGQIVQNFLVEIGEATTTN